MAELVDMPFISNSWPLAIMVFDDGKSPLGYGKWNFWKNGHVIWQTALSFGLAWVMSDVITHYIMIYNAISYGILQQKWHCIEKNWYSIWLSTEQFANLKMTQSTSHGFSHCMTSTEIYHVTKSKHCQLKVRVTSLKKLSMFVRSLPCCCFNHCLFGDVSVGKPGGMPWLTVRHGIDGP